MPSVFSGRHRRKANEPREVFWVLGKRRKVLCSTFSISPELLKAETSIYPANGKLIICLLQLDYRESNHFLFLGESWSQIVASWVYFVSSELQPQCASLIHISSTQSLTLSQMFAFLFCCRCCGVRFILLIAYERFIWVSWGMKWDETRTWV